MSRGGEETRIESGYLARWRLIAGFAMLVALFAFVVAVWFAFHESGPARSGPGEPVPIARAPDGPDRERPADPGGMDVPDRDKMVFDTFKPNGAREHERVERLLPPPEAPLPEPAPPRPSEAARQEQREAPPATGAPSSLPEIEIVERPEASPPPGPEATERQGEAAGAGATDENAPPPPPARPERFAALSKPDAPSSAPAAAAPKPAAAPAGDWMVQLAALREEAAAKAAWQQAKRDGGDLFNGLEPTIVRADLGDKGIYYRLRTGDFDSREAADAFCARLKAKGLGCLAARR